MSFLPIENHADQVRSKVGPDGSPCKRKSREGTTTYLWEFLLKLLQVCDQQHNMMVIIMVIMIMTMPFEIPYSIYTVGYKKEFFQKNLHFFSIFVYFPFSRTLKSSGWKETFCPSAWLDYHPLWHSLTGLARWNIDWNVIQIWSRISTQTWREHILSKPSDRNSVLVQCI